MLEPAEERRSLSQAAVADAGAVAERQAGEAAAVPGHRGHAVVADLWQHGQRQAVQVWVPNHLEGRDTHTHNILKVCEMFSSLHVAIIFPKITNK